jgi:hypothetical protein
MFFLLLTLGMGLSIGLLFIRIHKQFEGDSEISKIIAIVKGIFVLIIFSLTVTGKEFVSLSYTWVAFVLFIFLTDYIVPLFKPFYKTK